MLFIEEFHANWFAMFLHDLAVDLRKCFDCVFYFVVNNIAMVSQTIEGSRANSAIWLKKRKKLKYKIKAAK